MKYLILFENFYFVLFWLSRLPIQSFLSYTNNLQILSTGLLPAVVTVLFSL